MNGPWCALSVSELLTTLAGPISALRSLLWQEDLTSEYDDIWLLRFILSHKTPEACVDPVRRTIAWRKQNAAILEHARKTGASPYHEKVSRWIVAELHKSSYDESPLWVMRCGIANPKVCMEKATMEEVAVWILYQKEILYAICDEATRRTGRLVKCISVLDMNHYKMFGQDTRFLQSSTMAARQAEDFYPQLLGVTVVMNVPRVVSWMFQFSKRFLSQRTQEKMKICPGKMSDGILRCPFASRMFDPDNVPSFLGGCCECPMKGGCIQGISNTQTEVVVEGDFLVVPAADDEMADVIGAMEASMKPAASFADTLLRITTFNLRYDNPRDGEDAWAFRREDICAYVANHLQPTVFAVQEALLHQITDLERCLPHYGWTGRGREISPEKGEFCAVFYRKDSLLMTENGTFWLSETPDEAGSKHRAAALPRIVHWTQFKQVGTAKLFYVFNTHFDHVGRDARIFSAELLLDRVQVIAGLYPAIVLGDFNAQPQEQTYSIMTSSFLKDSALNAEESGTSSTMVASSRPATFTGFHNECADCIDYIFTSGFAVRSHMIMGDVRPNGRKLSDHRPIFAECYINV